MTEYNSRQFDLMLEAMDDFHRGTINIGAIISRLDSLLVALTGVDDKWMNAYRKQLGILEDVYAYALDKTLGDVPSNHMPLVNGAIAQIRQLVALKVGGNNTDL